MRVSNKHGWIRIATQVLFLGMFAFLLFAGRLQLWFGIFAIGIVLSPLLGRVYCGWMCPMNTLFKPISRLYAAAGWKRLRMPRFITAHPLIRIVPLAAFIAGMIAMRKAGISVPILAFMTLAAVFLTLFFEEAFWHNAVCPFGTLLSVSSRTSVLRHRIQEDKCISCGKCQKVCPVHAIDTGDDGKRSIRAHDCISCGECVKACPTAAIAYSGKSKP